MKAFAIKEGIYWVGAIDWAVRDFHGYETPRGTSYNNYLIMDEEITGEIVKLRATPMSAAIKKFWNSRRGLRNITPRFRACS